MKKRVALITWAGLLEGAESEQLLLPHLAAAGVEANIVDWNASCDFARFDLVILRTCWDYHLRGAEFTGWLRRTALAVPVLNDIETVLWNRDKFYLRELQAQGISIAPTVFICGNGAIRSEEWRHIRSWQKIVVKPAVSATAHKTWLFENTTLPDEDELKSKMQGEPFLVQQFIPEIETQGEISFVYLDGVYSHAVLKRPAEGDFRVQKDFGGSTEAFVPTAAQLKQANAIAAAVRHVGDSLYCRIDVIEKDGELILMEVELIEPELFLGLVEGAAERFAEAIAGRMR
jgi:glutathione synthase/RimK-type ligase-like ATP-grasp enzyme